MADRNPPPRKKEPVNGHVVGDEIVVRDEQGNLAEKRTMRHVGPAGFYVKGLATCFYWTERGVTWDELVKVGESLKLAKVEKES